MALLVAAQAIMACLAVLVSWMVGGFAAAISAAAGAGAYFVPNALFAVRLLVGLFSQGRSNPFSIFWGEALKLGSAVMLMALTVYLGGAWLVWPAFLFGLLCVLKGYVLLIIFGRRRRHYRV